MVVIYRVEVDDKVRRALARHYGDRGKATRRTVSGFIDALVTAALDDIVADDTKGGRIHGDGAGGR